MYGRITPDESPTTISRDSLLGREGKVATAVKNAMTEQTAAERARRAAILRADGEKRSAILKAEGLRQSMILGAEGERQSKVIRAEGERLSQILQMQGQAQGLGYSVGAAPLDKKAIGVLSLDTLKTMAASQATKIIFPFEISQLIRQSAKFLGAADETPEETAARPFCGYRSRLRRTTSPSLVFS